MADLADVLLLNRDDLMRITAFNGNIDEDKLLPHIKTAQDIHLRPVIGSKLMEKCKQLVADGTLNDSINANYKTLVYKYITPCLSFWSAWDAMPFIQYEIANGGVFQHNSENSATPSDESVIMLIQKFKDKAESYSTIMSDYLCDNSNKYPELNEATTGGEISPRGEDVFHGWNY